ncbi:MAG: UvrD-helicase domain-containing protein, partial [Chloroflexi bacterium]|nr:UvrD-helicase domain-containing protein [Chloroflexota bacterium]
RGSVWVSTFHRFCSRLLRRRAEIVGLQANFSIFDTTDQRQLLREVLHDLNIDAVHFSPNKVANRISRAKNNLQSADDVARSFDDAIGNHLAENAPDIRVGYTSASRFADHVATSLQQRMTEAFREAYSQWDVLILDDVQFLGGHVERAAAGDGVDVGAIGVVISKHLPLVGRVQHYCSGLSTSFVSADELHNAAIVVAGKARVGVQVGEGIGIEQRGYQAQGNASQN